MLLSLLSRSLCSRILTPLFMKANLVWCSLVRFIPRGHGVLRTALLRLLVVARLPGQFPLQVVLLLLLQLLHPSTQLCRPKLLHRKGRLLRLLLSLRLTPIMLFLLIMDCP